MSQDAKAELRERLQAWRRSLTDLQIQRWSEAIGSELLGLAPLGAARCVLGFVSLRREPQMHAVLEALGVRGVRILWPRVRAERLELVASLEDGPVISPEAVDVALVPGLGFDARGRRLGRGGGHYDRLLPLLRPDCLRVGVCFEGQIVPAVPVEPWDQAVDLVVSETGVRKGEARVGPGA